MANRSRPGAADLLHEIVEGLGRRGWTAELDPDLIPLVELDVPSIDWDELAADLVVTVGGDGTLLHAVRRMAGRRVPVFPVDLGGLGFLSAAAPDDLWDRLEPALRGEAPIERRMILEVGLRSTEGERARHRALNDAVVYKGGRQRTLDLRVRIGDAPLGEYRADGLILSTPTGATGYNLSAGGPLAVPDLELVLVTPICAHALSARPLVAAPDREITVEVVDGSEAVLVLDGQVQEPLQPGDVVAVAGAARGVELAGLDAAAYFDRLRSKLHWSGRADRQG